MLWFIQIRAYVYDVVRATLPRMSLDQAFEGERTLDGWMDTYVPLIDNDDHP